MALQLLKRNYTMNGYEKPKILKMPEGEMRWAPRRVAVDVGDVMLNVRLDEGKNKFVNEHVEKYARGINPYGEFGYPYKVNKSFRPPIVDPKLLEPLSRMPVKFDSISRGPIVKELYQQQIEIGKTYPKHTTINRVCSSARSNPAVFSKSDMNLNTEYDLQPRLRVSTTTNLSLPSEYATEVPELNLDPKIRYSAVANMYSPFVMLDVPNEMFDKKIIADRVKSSGTTNLSSLLRNGELGTVGSSAKPGSFGTFDARPVVTNTQSAIPIQRSCIKESKEYFTAGNDRFTEEPITKEYVQKNMNGGRVIRRK